MTIDLMTIPADEAERVAYSEGFTRTADLFARIADLELERDQLNDAVEGLEAELVVAYKDRRDALTEAESLRADLADYRWEAR